MDNSGATSGRIIKILNKKKNFNRRRNTTYNDPNYKSTTLLKAKKNNTQGFKMR